MLSVPRDYSTIAEALSAAAEGDLIRIDGGVYCERLQISKSITLLASAGGVAVLKQPRRGPLISVRAKRHIDVGIEGFTLEGSIEIAGSGEVNIRKDRFTSSSAGIIIRGDVHVTVEDTVLSPTEPDERDSSGILVAGKAKASMARCTVNNCSCGIVADCRVTENAALGIMIAGRATAVLERNTVSGNGIGIRVADQTDVTLVENEIPGNRFGGVFASETSMTIDVFRQSWQPGHYRGAIRGRANRFSENAGWGDFQPKGLEFLPSHTGGCYGRRCKKS